MEFKEKVKEYILKEEARDKEKHNSTEKSVYYASSLGGCPRFIYFEKIDPLDIDDATKRIFLVGDIFHTFVQEKLLDGYKTEVEVGYSYEGIKLKGRIDAIKDNEIIEIKTTSSQHLFEPKEEHVTQINTYMGITGVNEGRIVYINKISFECRAFPIVFSDELFRDTLNRIVALDKKINDKVGYEKIVPKMSPNCYYCKYKKRCLR